MIKEIDFRPTMALGRRTELGFRSGMLEVRKRAQGHAECSRLWHEYSVLTQLKGLAVPEVLHYESGDGTASLFMQYCQGKNLKDVQLTTDLQHRIRTALNPIHHLNFVHGDLAEEHIIIGKKIVFVDWEHAMKRADQISCCSFRPVRLGYSHPNLIWGKGIVEVYLDHWSLASIFRITL